MPAFLFFKIKIPHTIREVIRMENIYFKMNKAINKNIPNCKCNGLKLGKTGKSFQGKGLKKTKNYF